MGAPVLTVAQQKGGAGKTTVAAQLGVAFALGHNRRVTLVDVDPQGSLRSWFNARSSTYGAGEEGLACVDGTGYRLTSALRDAAKASDVVILDSPPHAESETRAAIRAASLVLVPVQPSPMDLWATAPTLELAKRERIQVHVVLNRMPSRGKLVEAMTSAITEASMTSTTAHLGNRVGFAAAMMTGQSVLETEPRSKAAAELTALAAEVLGLLGR